MCKSVFLPDLWPLRFACLPSSLQQLTMTKRILLLRSFKVTSLTFSTLISLIRVSLLDSESSLTLRETQTSQSFDSWLDHRMRISHSRLLIKNGNTQIREGT